MWSIREWYKWLGSLPWPLRWFPILVLFRPIIDNLYFLKEVSPFLSPLYIVGALTPVLCTFAIIRYNSAPATRGDQLFSVWSVMLFAACILLFFREPLSIQTAEFILKLTMPVYLFFFLRRLIRSRRDLQGVLMSFWLSAIPVALLLLYELYIQPVAIQESRGMERIQGSFGDVVSYGSYITFAVIIASYSLLTNSGRRFKLSWPWIITIGLGLLGLLNIHHLASYAVVACLLAYFVLIVLKYRSELGWALLLGIAIGVVYFGEDPIRERIIPLLETDFRVYRGEVGSEKLLHGRIGRWQEMARIFTTEPPHVQFLGFPLTLRYALHFVGIGAHNDLVRLMFLSGYLGLVTYLSMLSVFYSYARRQSRSTRFLGTATLMALLLFSVSTTPTFYAPFLYFVLTIFAYHALGAERSTHAEN